MQVLEYEQSLRTDWDEFVRRSNNGTFLFERAYMDYHADRFTDASLVIKDPKHRTIALFVASRSGPLVSAHGGLTYGGLVTSAPLKTASMLEVGAAVADHFRAQGVYGIRYKTIPRIYHRCPSDEDQYMLFRQGASLVRRDVLTVVEPARATPYEERRKRGIKRARQAQLVVQQSADLAAFWFLLVENLSSKHNKAPVHTVAEMAQLAASFPDHIRLLAAYDGSVMVAGIVVYESDQVAHVQYIASSASGRERGALDLVFDHAITEVYRTKPYFSFGISTEEDGKYLNEGLVAQKEGFGGYTVVHDHYHWVLE